jgi:primosomal protein N' (replication factor Y)
MAVVRAKIGNIPVLLASATPSLETWANVETGRYHRLELPARHAGAILPAIDLIDLRTDPPERQNWLSPTLRQAVAETLAAEEQAMLFLNRRGYAPLTLCRACGHRLACPQCSAWLVEHRQNQRLRCHYCGHTRPLPSVCPNCQKEGLLVPCGPGVERIVEETRQLFPDARLAMMTSDTLTSPRQVEQLIRQILDQEIDILVGTQVMAKGHHFPLLTLVGVVDADLGLGGGDLRAAERTYQLLHQVAGRAGRAERSGRVLIQSHMPEHPVMQALAAGDRNRFLAQELAERRTFAMPPFSRLAALIVSSPNPEIADRVAADLRKKAPRDDRITILGPAPAPLALLRGRHRRRLLLRAPRNLQVQSLLTDWLATVPVPASARIQVDIDPYNFL